MRLLVTVFALTLALLPVGVLAQLPAGSVPAGLSEAVGDCVVRGVGPAFEVTVEGDMILVDGEWAFSLVREEPGDRLRDVQVGRIGGDEVGHWLDDDPLSPRVMLKYGAGGTNVNRANLHDDPLYRLGVACFREAYQPRG